MRNLLIYVFSCFFLLSANAQYQVPLTGVVFDDSEVPRVDIFIDTDSLAVILDSDNLDSNHEFPATFMFTNSNYKDTVENVGFRLRGNTSRGAFKKSFKVSFNSFEKGQQFHGLEKMNLNGEHNDPSIMRSKLCWDMCRWAGVPSSRANHVRLYINSQYRGLYINVEHIDEEFIQKRMADDGGNLYKCLWPADLHYRGSDPNLYAESERWGRQAYALKTNLEEYDYRDIAHFIDVLNNFSGTDFQCELERIFDVDSYLKIIALDILTANWDGPIINKNNFYLYSDPCSGKFTYLPYDLDNTLGIDWFGEDWANSDIYKWSDLSGDYRPIYEKIMAVPEFKDRFSFYMNDIIVQFFNNNFLDNYLDENLEQLSPYRENDSFAGGDYGWSFNDFEKSFEEDLGAHVKHGLKDYINERSTSALDQLEEEDILPVVRNIAVDWSPNQVTFDIQSFDDNEITDLIFHYKVAGEDWKSEPLAIDTDGKSAHIHQNVEAGLMTYYVEATDDIGQSRSYPLCQNATVQLGYSPTSKLMINELMASNDSTVTDEFNEYDDWIEIYNAGDTVVPLNNYYLSDDRDNPTKWRLPSTILNPGKYIVIWADGTPEQGGFHANFKLKKEGEFLGIFDSKANHYAPVDEVNFPAQETDKSYARTPNGIGDFMITDNVTPFNNNDEIVGVENEKDFSNIVVYPNPFTNVVQIQSNENKLFDLICFDVNGRQIILENNTRSLQLDQLSSGIYFLEIRKGGQLVGREKLVKILR